MGQLRSARHERNVMVVMVSLKVMSLKANCSGFNLIPYNQEPFKARHMQQEASFL